MAWFTGEFGFAETNYQETKERFRVVGTRLIVRSDPTREYELGSFANPTLAELRTQTDKYLTGADQIVQVEPIIADVLDLHCRPENNGALVQVASQFNLLEMPHPEATPEDGLSAYVYDHTQGPACAMACAPATVYRNYLVPMGEQTGQTAARQLNMLQEINSELNVPGLDVRNGYAMASATAISAIDATLQAMSEQELDGLRSLLRIGLCTETEVSAQWAPHGQLISQAFCSALPIAYNPGPTEPWVRFAQLILDSTYEATLRAAILNHQLTGNNRVYLTLVGGGVFGNQIEWILASIQRAVQIVAAYPLDIKVVCYRSIPEAVKNAFSRPGSGCGADQQ